MLQLRRGGYGGNGRRRRRRRNYSPKNTEPPPMLPNPVQMTAVPEESGQPCGGGAISTGTHISGSGGGCGDGRREQR